MPVVLGVLFLAIFLLSQLDPDSWVLELTRPILLISIVPGLLFAFWLPEFVATRIEMRIKQRDQPQKGT